MEITIRKGRVEDAPFVAQVVAMAIGDVSMLESYCGEKYLEVLERIVRLEGSQYNYENSFVAQVGGVQVGAVVGYDGGQLAVLRERTLSVVHQYNPGFEFADDETQAGEFYIDSLGVRPDYRGMGIGGKLLAAATAYAFDERGHSCIGLLVDFDNSKAERLYRSLGFKRIAPKMFLGHQMWHLQKAKQYSYQSKQRFAELTPQK